MHMHTHAPTQLFNGTLSGTTLVGWYQKKWYIYIYMKYTSTRNIHPLMHIGAGGDIIPAHNLQRWGTGELVDKFCYLDDMLSVDGDADQLWTVDYTQLLLVKIALVANYIRQLAPVAVTQIVERFQLTYQWRSGSNENWVRIHDDIYVVGLHVNAQSQTVHTRLAKATVNFGNQEVNQLKIATLSDQGRYFQGGPRFVSRMDGGP